MCVEKKAMNVVNVWNPDFEQLVCVWFKARPDFRQCLKSGWQRFKIWTKINFLRALEHRNESRFWTTGYIGFSDAKLPKIWTVVCQDFGAFQIKSVRILDVHCNVVSQTFAINEGWPIFPKRYEHGQFKINESYQNIDNPNIIKSNTYNLNNLDKIEFKA